MDVQENVRGWAEARAALGETAWRVAIRRGLCEYLFAWLDEGYGETIEDRISAAAHDAPHPIRLAVREPWNIAREAGRALADSVRGSVEFALKTRGFECDLTGKPLALDVEDEAACSHVLFILR
ncbi:MAG: hypothetical protein Q4B30_06785 [Coriobacteriaceae bacterium]|nr:hypothetical protein [Coriobacteriaceae bacterium]